MPWATTPPTSRAYAAMRAAIGSSSSAYWVHPTRASRTTRAEGNSEASDEITTPQDRLINQASTEGGGAKGGDARARTTRAVTPWRTIRRRAPLELKSREYALRMKGSCCAYRESSADAGQRVTAADALGTQRKSTDRSQPWCGPRATPTMTFRNEAIAALGVLASGSPPASQIELTIFIDMITRHLERL